MAIRIKPVLKLALGGLGVGLPLGALGAGIYATWAVGGDVANVGFGTILSFLPEDLSLVSRYEPTRTALILGGAIPLVTAMAAAALGLQQRPTSHGSARWATPEDIKEMGMRTRLKGVQAPLLAKLGGPRSRSDFVTTRGEDQPHTLVVAPTRSGKGVGIVIPTLLTFPGSIICVDIKGENFAATSRHRARIETVYKIAPYDRDGRTHRYNPVDIVTAAAPRFRWSDANDLAACLLTDKTKSDGSKWLGGCREIFSAGVLLAIERGTPTIAAVHDMFATEMEYRPLMRHLAEEVVDPEARRAFLKYAGYEDETLSSYMSIMNDGGLNLWNNPLIRELTSRSDFCISDLRRNPKSIFLVIPQKNIGMLAPFVRLFFQQVMAILQSSEPDPESGEIYPVLFMLDEFRSMGRMNELATGITTLAGYGGRLVLIVQSLANLHELYDRDGANNFMSNCDVQLFMSTNDPDTPDYISKSIGDFTRPSKTRSWRTGGFSSPSYSERMEGARLIRPEDTRKLGKKELLMLVRDSDPIRTKKIVYHKDRYLAPLYRSQRGPLPEPPSIDQGDVAYAATIPPVPPPPPAKAASKGGPPEAANASRPVRPPSKDAKTTHPAEAPTEADELPRSSRVARQSPRPNGQDPAPSAPRPDPVPDHPDDTMDEKTEAAVYAQLGGVLSRQGDFTSKVRTAQGKRFDISAEGGLRADRDTPREELDDSSVPAPPRSLRARGGDFGERIRAARDANLNR